MKNEDAYTGLWALLSAILAVLSYIWNIPILQFSFTFILGTLVTYFVQSKLQDRAEKRKITREKIEKIYGPLYVELQRLKENLIDNLEPVPSLMPTMTETEAKLSTWEKIRTCPEFFSVPAWLRDDTEFIIGKAVKMCDSLYEIKRIVDYALIEMGTSVLKQYYQNSGSRISERALQQFYITAKSKTGAHFSARWLYDCVILNKDPIEDIKQKSYDFSYDRCYVHLVVEDSHQVGKDNTIDVPLTEIQKDLNRFLEITRQKVVQEKEVSKFLEERDDLSARIDKILRKIKEHIERNYPMERI